MEIGLSLRHKLLLPWVGSILVTLILVAGLFYYLHTATQINTALEKINVSFATLNAEIKHRRGGLEKNVKIIARRDDIISSMHMISTYQDIKNYQPLVFDAEKQRLAYEISKQAAATNLDVLVVHGRNSLIASFYLGGSESESKKGYLSFQQGRPVLFTAGSDGIFRQEKTWAPLLKKLTETKDLEESQIIPLTNQQGLVIETHAPVVLRRSGGPDKIVGTVRAASLLESVPKVYEGTQ